MKHRLSYQVFLLFFVICALPSLSNAHDKSLHKGKSLEGSVIEVKEDSLTIENTEGKKDIALSEHTKFEKADDAAERKDLKVGQSVAVFVTKLPGGKLAAKEIIIKPVPDDGSRQPHHRTNKNAEDAD